MRQQMECTFCGEKSHDLDVCSECGELFCPQCGVASRRPVCLECWIQDDPANRVYRESSGGWRWRRDPPIIV